LQSYSSMPLSFLISTKNISDKNGLLYMQYIHMLLSHFHSFVNRFSVIVATGGYAFDLASPKAAAQGKRWKLMRTSSARSALCWKSGRYDLLIAEELSMHNLLWRWNDPSVFHTKLLLTTFQCVAQFWNVMRLITCLMFPSM
jgi:hypothetical protein